MTPLHTHGLAQAARDALTVRGLIGVALLELAGLASAVRLWICEMRLYRKLRLAARIRRRQQARSAVRQ